MSAKGFLIVTSKPRLRKVVETGEWAGLALSLTQARHREDSYDTLDSLKLLAVLGSGSSSLREVMSCSKPSQEPSRPSHRWLTGACAHFFMSLAKSVTQVNA